jgi:hypothetical protein
MRLGTANFQDQFTFLIKNRSGIAITSSYAVGQCSRFLRVCFLFTNLTYNIANYWPQTVDNNEEFHELQGLQERLDSKIRASYPCHVINNPRFATLVQAILPFGKRRLRNYVLTATDCVASN